MKQFYTILLALAVLFALPSVAQITINSGDLTPTIGSMYVNYDVSGPITVDVGTTGGPQTWTFNETLYPNGTTVDFTVIDPTTSAFNADFPSANYAYRFLVDTVQFDFFFGLNSTDLRYYGGGGFSADTSFTTKFDPEQLLVTFPMQLGGSYNDSYVLRFGIPGVFESIDSTSVVATYDAWGTVVTPAGSYDVLRVCRNKTEITTVVVNGLPISTTSVSRIEYEWLSSTFGPVAVITSEDDEANPNFTQASSVDFRVSAISGIEDNAAEIQSFSLNQNYPNPFNPSTEIAFELTRAMEAELTVYNVAGQAIATLASGLHTSGQHRVTFDAANLPAGIYFYRLSAGGTQQIKQMVLLK